MMRKIIKSFLVTGMLVSSPSAFAFDIGAMTKTEEAEFGEQIRNYIIENPDIVMEALRILDQRQQVADAQEDTALITAHLSEIQNDGFSWVGGNPEGDITVVEFLDYRCGYCRKAHDQVASLVKNDGNIRLVVKEYPILGPDSLASARIAIATLQSLGPDAYYKMYNLLIKHQGPTNDAAVSKLAKKAGLDGNVIKEAMEKASVDEQIKKTRELGQALNISGTPTFIISDQIVRGYVPAGAMTEMVADLRKKKEQ